MRKIVLPRAFYRYGSLKEILESVDELIKCLYGLILVDITGRIDFERIFLLDRCQVASNISELRLDLGLAHIRLSIVSNSLLCVFNGDFATLLRIKKIGICDIVIIFFLLLYFLLVSGLE